MGPILTRDRNAPFPLLLKGYDSAPGECWILSSEKARLSSQLLAHIKQLRKSLLPPPYTLRFTEVSHRQIGRYCVELISGHIPDFSKKIARRPFFKVAVSGNKVPSPLKMSVSYNTNPKLLGETIIVKRTFEESLGKESFLQTKDHFPDLSFSTNLEEMPISLCNMQSILLLQGRNAEELSSWTISLTKAEMYPLLAARIEQYRELGLSAPYTMRFGTLDHLELGYHWVELITDGNVELFNKPHTKRARKPSLEDLVIAAMQLDHNNEAGF